MPEILSIGELLALGNSANMSAYVPYSGLEYNASGAISGISGSAIAGGIESSVVSSIVSSMVSGKADQSAVEECCSAMSAEVSSKLDASASSLFQPSGSYMPSGEYYSATNPSGFITTADLTDYAKESALSSKLDASASSNFAPSGDYVFESSYSSFTSEVTNNISSISSTVSGLTGTYIEQSASGMFAPSGDYAYNSSVSAKLDASSSSLFAPSGDYAYNSALSSYIPSSASGQFAPSGDYAYNSALSSKLDASASSEFYLASNPSGFITGVNLDGYATTGYVDSSVSGKADQSALDNCCSAMSSVVSAKADSSALTSYVPYSSLKNGPTTATISAIDSSAVYDYSAHARINTLSTNKIPYSALEYSAGTNTITAISGSAIAGQNFNPSQLQLIVDSANMSASSVANGVQIGIKDGIYQPVGNYQTAGNYATGLSVVAVSNSSQATATNVVYIVTG